MIKADLITIVYCRGDHSAMGVTTVRSILIEQGFTSIWIIVQGLLQHGSYCRDYCILNNSLGITAGWIGPGITAE